jgi:biotin transporter BioY
MWYAVKYGLYSGSFRGGGSVNLGPTLLGWVLSAMLIGYMAGALNKRSENFRRMVIVGVVTTTMGGVFLLGMFQLSPSNVVPFDLSGFSLNVLTRIAAGVIIPIIAKVFMWYGVVLHKT